MIKEHVILTSKILFDKLKELEGCRLEAYQDAAGTWTIGYGHTYGVKKGDKISQWYAEENLRKDIEMAERQVLALDVCEKQAQLDALVCLVFNVGIGKLKSSTLLTMIKAKWPKSVVMKEWKKWSYAGGKRLRGLERRRVWEANRFFDPSPTLAQVRERLQNPLKNHDTEEDDFNDRPY